MIPITNKILFADIETVPEFDEFTDMPQEGQEVFKNKFAREIDQKFKNGSISFYMPGKSVTEDINVYGPEEAAAMVYKDIASFYAEFAKVVCISMGRILITEGKETLHIGSLYNDNDNERSMLERFTKSASQVDMVCAHNGKEFDYPFLCKRLIKFGLKLPDVLNNTGKKPWETRTVDTMEMWKMGSYKGSTSLALISYMLGLPSPKAEMDGGMVWGYYKEGKELEISQYCEGDVVSLVNVYRRMLNEPIFEPDMISRSLIQLF